MKSLIAILCLVNGIHAMYDFSECGSCEDGWKRVSKNGRLEKESNKESKKQRSQRKHAYRKDQKQFQQNNYHDQRPKHSNKE